ncbi:MAG: hypothetical protein ACPG80_04025, partial [Rickettsiales bacterium]
VGGFLFKEAKTRSQAFRDALDRFSLKLPVVGPIMHSSCYARFTRTLATTFSAGVPLVDALDSVAGATGNVATEDLAYLFASIGVETGVDLGKLVAAAEFMLAKVGVESPSKVHRVSRGK